LGNARTSPSRRRFDVDYLIFDPEKSSSRPI
jgi:hypothetical protein